MLWWLRIKGTVILHIWWQILAMMAYTACIVAVDKHTEVKLGFGQTLIPVIGAVVSLLMGFRTNSAYARYWDGRTIWSQMVKNVRQLVLCIWINVNGATPKDIVEKKSAINLCMAFAIATKHYLREEYDYNTDDMKELIFHLKKYYNAPATDFKSKWVRSASVKNRETSLKMRDRKDGEVMEELIKEPFSTDGKPRPKPKVVKTKSAPAPAPPKQFKLMAYDIATPTNIPLEILCHLLSYVNYVASNKLGETFCINTMNNGIGALMDNLTSFERVLRTPIPLAYSIHLHHCVWLYLLAVPFQFVGTHGWGAIIIVGCGSFCMLGILSIAYEIENPFGYDANDLPLDDFCEVLKREIEVITGTQAPVSDDWVHSPLNRPLKFSFDCDMSATEMQDKSPEEIQSLMEDSAKLHYWVEKLRRKQV